MAAYAALVSLMHIIDDIQNHHSPPISLYKFQTQSLIQHVLFLQEFLQGYKSPASDSDEADPLEMHIAAAAYAAEKKSGGMKVFSDHVLHGIMEKLMSYESGRQVIPITGMGGIGKTALAQTVYSQKAIIEHFDICAWATISEQYNTREILCELVSQATKRYKEQFSVRSEHELGQELYQYLSGRRFLIVMVDMWNIESWDEIQRFFPNNENHSRIMVTTRQSQLASQLNNHYSHSMEFLDEATSWVLLSKTVFGEEPFPLDMEKVGKEIAHNCRGLPLSIVVVGGILKNMERTEECLESIRNNLTLVVNVDNDKHCLTLLKMSYDHLSVYLKPCFLYMGVFEEDEEIHISKLINLWVGKGFLYMGVFENNWERVSYTWECLRTIGKGFLKDLVDRNLILVHKLGSAGNIKQVKVHDLVRDLCVNQGKKEGFYHVLGESSPRDIKSHRRIVIRRDTSKKKVVNDLKSMSHARSIIYVHGKVPRCGNYGLLRTVHAYRSLGFQYVKLRYLADYFDAYKPFSLEFTKFWEMVQLRHIDRLDVTNVLRNVSDWQSSR